jgi:hypothetical protein
MADQRQGGTQAMRRMAISALVGAGVWLAAGPQAAGAEAASWQILMQPPSQIGRFFDLGIRNKWGSRSYFATFVVHTPGGRTHRKMVRVLNDFWGQARYPQSFGAPHLPGRYTYEVVVHGKTVVRAAFELR